MLSDTASRKLLEIARETIEGHVREKTTPVFEVEDRELLETCGAFVTLHKSGALRGCIGVFESNGPLYKTVVEMALAAATQDPRFMPVDLMELSEIDIEISVLSPLEKIDDPTAIEVGRHGIYIVKEPHRGVLLPQVAVEHGLDRVAFLEQTCLKAGLPKDAWLEGADILIFEAEILKEEKEEKEEEGVRQ